MLIDMPYYITQAFFLQGMSEKIGAEKMTKYVEKKGRLWYNEHKRRFVAAIA